MVALFLFASQARIAFGGFEQAVPLYFGRVSHCWSKGARASRCSGVSARQEIDSALASVLEMHRSRNNPIAEIRISLKNDKN